MRQGRGEPSGRPSSRQAWQHEDQPQHTENQVQLLSVVERYTGSVGLVVAFPVVLVAASSLAVSSLSGIESRRCQARKASRAAAAIMTAAQRRHGGVVFVVPLPVELPGDRIKGTDLG